MNNNKINEFCDKYGKLIMLHSEEEGLVISIVDTMVDGNEDYLVPNESNASETLEYIIDNYPFS